MTKASVLMKRMNRTFGSRKKLIVLNALTQCHLLHDQYSVKNPTDTAIKLKDKNNPYFWKVVSKPTLLIPENLRNGFYSTYHSCFPRYGKSIARTFDNYINHVHSIII